MMKKMNANNANQPNNEAVLIQLRRRYWRGIILLLFALLAGRASAQIYHVIDLGTPPGQQISIPHAINNNAQVAGQSESFAFRYTNGVMENLGTLPGGSISVAYGINAAGQVVGQSQYSGGGSIRHATLWSNGPGTAMDLGTLPAYGNYSNAVGINSATQIVGYAGPSLDAVSTTGAFIWESETGIRDLGLPIGSRALSINNGGTITGVAPLMGGPRRAFIRDPDGTLQSLGSLGGTVSQGNFINGLGHVAGQSDINNFDNREHAFLYDGTTLRDLGSLGSGNFLSDRSFGYGINNNDEVVGSTYRPYDGDSLYQIAFVYRNGEMLDLETLVDESGADYRLYSANAINDAGQMVVDAIKRSTSQIHAVLLTPNGTPTPTPTPTATPTPTPGPITLSAVGRKVGGINTVRLIWSGATSANIDVFRNNALIATVPNRGNYNDSTGETGRAQYMYHVCEAGTSTCSNDVTVRFRR